MQKEVDHRDQAAAALAPVVVPVVAAQVVAPVREAEAVLQVDQLIIQQ